jgi:hypothetical protein
MTDDCAPIDSGLPDSNRDLPIELLGQARLEAICDYYVRCGVAEAITTCVESFQNTPFAIGLNFERQVAAVKAGAITYQPDKMRICFEGIAGLSCQRSTTNGLAGPIECTQGLTGTVTDGGTCIINEQCVSQICTMTSCPNACCTGTCMGSTAPAERTVTQSCTTRDVCVDGYCETGVCMPLKQQGASCTSPLQCASGLTCKGAAMTCEPLSDTGGMCNSTTECTNSADVCRSGSCMNGGLVGSPCASPSECQPFHACNASTCELLPGLNEPCNPNMSCRVGYCNGTMCVPKLADGMTCDPVRGGFDCAGGICNTNSMCASQPTCF